MHEAVRDRYEAFRAGIAPSEYPSTDMLDRELIRMEDLLENAWLTVNFNASDLFRSDASSSNYLNTWERGDGPLGYLNTRDAREQDLGRFGRDPNDLFPPANAAQQRVRTYLSQRDGDLFQPSARPRYGALDYARCYHGGAPLYGKSFLVLREHVKHRSTFTPKDSLNFATSKEVDEQTTTFPDIEKLLLYCPDWMLKDIREYALGYRAIGTQTHHRGDYLEAQMYSEISFERDVAEIRVAVNQELTQWDYEEVQSLRDRLRSFAYDYGVDIYEI